jgi:hypothetical protein
VADADVALAAKTPEIWDPLEVAPALSAASFPGGAFACTADERARRRIIIKMMMIARVQNDRPDF